MTNAEKYKDEIIAQECKTGDWAIDRRTGEIVECNDFLCSECLFHKGWCVDRRAEWLNAEYKDQKEFTDDERKLMELFDKAEWVARDYDDTLWIFSKKPHKEAHGRWSSYGEYCCISNVTSLPFAAIKPTDTEPTSRAEILGEK